MKKLFLILAICLSLLPSNLLATGLDFDVNRPYGTDTISNLDDYLRETRLDVMNFGIEEHQTTGKHKIPSTTTGGLSSLTPTGGRLVYNTSTGALLFGSGTAWVGSNGSLSVPYAVISTYSGDLTAALAALGTSARAVLAIDSTATISAHTTVPANVLLWFVGEGKVTLGAYNLTMSGNVQAERKQIFDCSGAGRVLRGTTEAIRMVPEWWGAAADGTTNDYAYINLALTFAGVTYDSALDLTPGKTYMVRDNLLTIPAAVDVLFNAGAKFKLLNHNIAFYRQLQAPVRPLFVYTGSGVAVTGTAGFTCESAWFPTPLPDAISFADGNQTTINVSTTSLTLDYTVPSTVAVQVRKGNVISIATTKTLTINGTFDSGNYQVFSCTGTGKVVFAAGAVKEYHPEWWATNTTPGTTDMSAAILAAYIACQNTPKGKILFSPTRYAVANVVFPTNWPNWTNNGITFQGSGPGTVIVPAAAHTSANFLFTFDADVVADGGGTGWINLLNFTMDANYARCKGILIRPSNNFRLEDIALLNFRGTALEAERPYDLYCTKVRCYNSGSFANSEAAIRMIPDPAQVGSTVTWGNQVYWTDCNIEAFQYRGLDLIGCSLFDAKGGKVHGSTSDVTTSLGNVYIDGGGLIRFTSVNITHIHRGPGVYIKDDDLGVYHTRVFFTGCTISEIASYDPGIYPIYGIQYAGKHGNSQLQVVGCQFANTSGISMTGSDRYIKIDEGSFIWRVSLANNLYPINTTAFFLQDDRSPWYQSTTMTPATYISTTKFSISGIADSAFLVGRPVKAVVAGGSVYSTIAAADYNITTPLTTTVTLVDAVLTDPITNVYLCPLNNHIGSLNSEVHALNLVLGHDTVGGHTVAIANNTLHLTPSIPGIIALEPETGTGTTDDLSVITGGRMGQIIVLRPLLQADAITVKHSVEGTGPGNIYLTSRGDCLLNSNKKAIVLLNVNGYRWVQVGGTPGKLPVYANNTLAVAGGLAAGEMYRTGADPDPVCIVH